jgi:Flp pilus assembly protein CpaB
MRRLPPWLWLMMALVFGAVATFMAMGWLKSQSQRVAQPKTPEMVSVVVAAKDVPPTVALSGDQLTVRQWPQDSAMPGKFSRSAEVEGRVTAIPPGRRRAGFGEQAGPQRSHSGLDGPVAPG